MLLWKLISIKYDNRYGQYTGICISEDSETMMLALTKNKPYQLTNMVMESASGMNPKSAYANLIKRNKFEIRTFTRKKINNIFVHEKTDNSNYRIDRGY